MLRVFMVLWLGAVSPLALGGASGLWISGDIRGALLPCFQCLDTAEPGLARQLGIMQEVAANDLWLDAGGFLDGGEVDLLGVQESLALAKKLGVKALHLTWRDVSPALADAFMETEVPLLSANITDAEGVPLVAPSWVVDHGGHRVGIVGLSGVPAGYQDLPAWQLFSERFRLREAGEALEDTLEALPNDLDRIVVLYAGDHGILRHLIAQAGERVDAFIMGSSFGTLYSTPPEGVIDARSQAGRRVTHLELSGMTAEYHAVTLNSPLSDSAVQVLESAGLQHTPRTYEPRPSLALPAVFNLEPPSQAPLLLEQNNRVMGVSVLGLETRSDWYGQSTAEGEVFLILDLLFENHKPFDLIQQDSGQHALRVGNLQQNLVLVAGSKAHAVINEMLSGDELFPDTFVLAQPGEVRRGKVVYRLAEESPGPLSLRFYHIEYPVIATTLQESTAQMAEPPPIDLQHHHFLELGVAQLEEIKSEQLGRPADNQRFVAIDLLGRSRLTRTNPANHHDADADPDGRVETPRAVPYLYADQHIQLVSPEGYIYLPDWELSELERIPTFLPDLLTGGRVIFLVPEAIDNYRVSLYFPDFGTVTEGTFGFPEPMFFGSNVESFTYRERDTVVDFDLEQLRVRIIGLERTDQGIEVEVEIFNETEGPGFWPMESRLGISLADTERRITATAMTDAHGTPLPWNAYLPPGEPRRMHLHFALDEPSGEGEIDVRGLTGNPARPIVWDEQRVFTE